MNMAKYTDEYYEFDKANSAYNRGGPESMLSMLNTNLDLALTDYVTVNFKALADAIDVLGGLDIEMTNAECVHANNYNREVSEAQGVEYEAIRMMRTLGMITAKYVMSAVRLLPPMRGSVMAAVMMQNVPAVSELLSILWYRS